ncbi:uncharacterized protein LOC111829965 [Capsella rubella]|uniref:uncharacterized protein LOC111829965 n=1 Tax=Capsella rubella TaxID=81985 RepID=UPI000CD4BBD1|nr:uncharacterized protein LOC111829965 [Capsella rubella]
MHLSLPKVIDAGLSHMMDDKATEFSNHVATPREVENDISLKEKLSETTASQVCENKTCEQPTVEARVKAQLYSTSSDLASNITLIKVEIMPNTLNVIFTFLLKGEPPDAPCIMKTEQHQERGYDADIRTRSAQEHTKPVYMETFKESLSKWSSDQVQGEGLIIHHDINHKKSDSSRGIKNQQVKSPYYWDMTVALFFPYLRFVPMGLPKKVFNEATPSHQGIIYHPYDSKMIADVHSDLLADKHAELLADLTTQETNESLLTIYEAKGDQASKNPSLFTYARLEASYNEPRHPKESWIRTEAFKTQGIYLLALFCRFGS